MINLLLLLSVSLSCMAIPTYKISDSNKKTLLPSTQGIMPESKGRRLKLAEVKNDEMAEVVEDNHVEEMNEDIVEKLRDIYLPFDRKLNARKPIKGLLEI